MGLFKRKKKNGVIEVAAEASAFGVIGAADTPEFIENYRAANPDVNIGSPLNSDELTAVISAAINAYETDDLTAVIAAAIAAYEGGSIGSKGPSGLYVKKLDRSAGFAPAWGVMGNREAIDARRI